VGDQIGEALGGTLYYVPETEFRRLQAGQLPPAARCAAFATLCRINVLYMIARAGSGHIGSSFSSMEILSWLHLEHMRRPADAGSADLFFSSKGHDAPALYNVLIALGRLPFEKIHALRRLGGLPGHPDVGTPAIVTNTGSLGMGVSKAKGMLYARAQLGRSGRVFVMTGDGELQEGQFWESLISAANHGLSNLTVIVDHNKLQSDTLVSKVSDLGDLEAKMAAFGWFVVRCDGNDVDAVADALARTAAVTDRPQVIIADTIKGKGVSFMEHTSIDSDVELYRFHSGAPSEDAYRRAVQKLIDTARSQFEGLGIDLPVLESVERPQVIPPADTLERLIPAYTEALLAEAARNPRVVALDADLILDTGLIPFQAAYPDRFVECGIAEQDMVSQAGGMALMGLLPVVHSFACFLSARPNEQIYNNATEHTKIVYVGSLAGVVPAGPGHSHQAVRDISALGGIPGLTLMEPSCAAEVAPLLDWALNVTEGSSYLRLMSLPWRVPYSLPAGHAPRLGQGNWLREGRDAAIIGYGPVLLSAACDAADRLAAEKGLSVGVLNLPWLNAVDADWLKQALAGVPMLLALDNHYAVGGQGDRVASAIAGHGIPTRLLRLQVDDVPQSGANPEILALHRLDADAMVETILGARR
jgi:transketolase